MTDDPDDPLLDLMEVTTSHYNNGEYEKAAVSINKVWVGTYEAVHVAHDMIPLIAHHLLERVELFPTVTHSEKWWSDSFTSSLNAISSLCQEALDRL
tara:strand:+ start:265 stop:555 length:291 start_codon:yes stop_codon:yes gene_type:complete